VNQLLLPAPDKHILIDRLIDAAVCWVQKTGYICRLNMFPDMGEPISGVIVNTGLIWCNTSCLDIDKLIPDLTINLSAGTDMLAGMIDFLED